MDSGRRTSLGWAHRPDDRRRMQRARRNSSSGRTHAGRSLNSPSYQIRPHAISFDGRPGRRLGLNLNSRMLVFLALAIVVAFLLIFGIVGCVRGCSAGSGKSDEPVNPNDARVAYGTDETLTSELGAVLDQDEKVAWIAAHADSYADPRIVELALREPEAVDFVRSLPKNGIASEGEAYGDEVTQGTYPQLYNWDERWGYVEYGGQDLPLGVTGSGPTCLAMAYMGLTGKSDRTPADMAALAEEGDYANGDEFCDASFFVNEASGLGLTCVQIEVSTTQLDISLDSYVVIARANADTLTDEAHWIFIVGENSNGSVTVYDPTSSEVTSRQWAPGTIVDSCGGFYALALA